MANSDEIIRDKIEAERRRTQIREHTIAATKEQRRSKSAASEANASVVYSESPEIVAKRERVIELCAKFAVWGTKHAIPYNSPSIYAEGWVLGWTSGEPSMSHRTSSFNGGDADGGYEFYESSTRKLLVDGSGLVQEIITDDITKPNFIRKFPSLQARYARPVEPRPENYDIGTPFGIEAEIAKFAVKYEVEW